MRAATAVLPLLLALGAVPAPAPADPGLIPQNDAGSGADAPNVPELALALLPGTYEGMLVALPVGEVVPDPVLDAEDWYRVLLPRNAFVTVRLELPAGQGLGHDDVDLTTYTILELYNPGGHLATWAQVFTSGRSATGWTITDEKGWWTVRVHTLERGANYRFSVDVAEPDGPHAAAAGNGWLAFGYTIGPDGGSVRADLSAVGRYRHQGTYGMNFFAVRMPSWEVVWNDQVVGLPTWTAAAVRTETVGVDLLDQPVGTDLPVRRVKTFESSEPGTHWLIVMAKAEDMYLVIDADVEGDVVVHKPRRGAASTLYAYRHHDFEGTLGVTGPAVRVSKDLSVQADVDRHLLGFYRCASSLARCRIIDPEGATQELGAGFPMLNSGLRGTWTFTRDQEAEAAQDMYLLLAADVALPEHGRGKSGHS